MIAREPSLGARAKARTPPITLEWLFRNHADDVHRIVTRLLGPAGSADVDDLTQQVFIAVQRALPKFRGDSKVTTWLYGITTRVVLKHLRSRRRRNRMLDNLKAMTEIGLPSGPHPESEVANRQALHQVWEALMHIHPQKRVVFLLYEVEGLSGKEIAQALDVKPATVFTRLHRARQELDTFLKKAEVAL